MLFDYAPNNLARCGRVMRNPQMPFHAPLIRNRRRKRDRRGKGGDWRDASLGFSAGRGVQLQPIFCQMLAISKAENESTPKPRFLNLNLDMLET